MTPEQRREWIREERVAVLHHENIIERLVDDCVHALRELTAEELADPEMAIEASCTICDSYFGWRCQQSPDTVCHYDLADHQQVELITGEMVIAPPDGLEGEETEQGLLCLFCGLPEFRE